MIYQSKIDVKKLVSLVVGVLLSAALAYVTQPKFHGNDGALQILVTIFSIFAGFIVAIMAIIGDDKTLLGRTWRHDVFYLLEIEGDLIRHKVLFHLYLFVLVLALLVSLKIPWYDSVEIWIERILLCIAYIAICVSFFLPKQLTDRKLKTLKKAIKEKKDAS